MVKTDAKKTQRAPTEDVVTREYTINLHKRLHQVGYKKRAPQAIKEIKAFAKQMMKTSDNRVDVDLNKYLWSQGIKKVPFRVRIRLSRKRNEDAQSGEKLYTDCTFVPVKNPKGMETVKIE